MKSIDEVDYKIRKVVLNNGSLGQYRVKAKVRFRLFLKVHGDTASVSVRLSGTGKAECVEMEHCLQLQSFPRGPVFPTTATPNTEGGIWLGLLRHACETKTKLEMTAPSEDDSFMFVLCIGHFITHTQVEEERLKEFFTFVPYEG